MHRRDPYYRQTPKWRCMLFTYFVLLIFIFPRSVLHLFGSTVKEGTAETGDVRQEIPGRGRRRRRRRSLCRRSHPSQAPVCIHVFIQRRRLVHVAAKRGRAACASGRAEPTAGFVHAIKRANKRERDVHTAQSAPAQTETINHKRWGGFFFSLHHPSPSPTGHSSLGSELGSHQTHDVVARCRVDLNFRTHAQRPPNTA